MWLQLALWTGAVVLVAGVLKRLLRRRSSSKRIDVGSVSESWLAEQRGRRNE